MRPRLFPPWWRSGGRCESEVAGAVSRRGGCSRQRRRLTVKGKQAACRRAPRRGEGRGGGVVGKGLILRELHVLERASFVARGTDTGLRRTNLANERVFNAYSGLADICIVCLAELRAATRAAGVSYCPALLSSRAMDVLRAWYCRGRTNVSPVGL